MFYRKTILVVTGFMFAAYGLCYAQMDSVPDDYYLFPIKPGNRNTLAGTMGELRSTHFHTGIDIRTGGVQGLPVHAAADGYISRIAVSPNGYGNALYITHDNGQTTVYAHLKEFTAPVKQYVIGEQYKRKSFQVNLFPPKYKFSVHKGDTIAHSGNSGSSAGPHLHFDIRNDKQAVLNPLEYNFEEIIDTRAPEVRKIALKTMDKHSRINNRFGRFEFNVIKSGNHYIIEEPIQVYGSIAVELYAYDRQDWTKFHTGINEIVMEIDNQEVFRQVIREIPFSKSRNFYNHINYRQLKETGLRFHKLYVDNGNEFDFYTTNKDKGILTFDTECEHELVITMHDTYRNRSFLKLNLRCILQSEPIVDTGIPGLDESTYEILDNTLIVYSVIPENVRSVPAVFFSGLSSYLIDASYTLDNVDVYLWDLTFGLPDSVELCNTKEYFSIDAMIPSAKEYQFYSHNIEASFSKRSLFDTIFLDVGYDPDFNGTGELFLFGSDQYPVRSNIEVSLIPDKIYPDRDRTHVYSVDDAGNFYFSGGTWDGDKIKFKTRTFGAYTLVEDSIPPEIRPLIINSEKLVFKINDKLSGIKSYELTLNDAWVLMNYDPKTRQIWSVKLDEKQPLEGRLVLKVTDNAGNEKVHKSKILSQNQY